MISESLILVEAMEEVLGSGWQWMAVASRRRTAGAPALASSKKESVSGSLAAWQDAGRNMVKLHCNRFK